MLTSRRNPRIRQVARLRQRRARDREGAFVVEGVRELSRAAEAGVPVREVFHCPALYRGEEAAAVVARLAAAGAEPCATSADVFRAMSYRDSPDGLIGVAAMAPPGLDGLAHGDAAAPGLWLVVEAVEKPGNLGAMLRSADAAGSGVIVCDPVTDVFNPNVVRASIGTVFTVPLAVASAADTAAWLDARGIRAVAATPEATVPYSEANLGGDIAIVIGSEHAGLSRAWRHGVDSVRIPMAGHADSVNAAMAATILLFEARRQRE